MAKKLIDDIDGTPEKRLFLSIISDYDLHTGICELVDNALDVWAARGKKKNLNVSISLDKQRQMITVIDDAGGLKEEDLRLLVAPGATGNAPNTHVIGIFGVGGKRAGVALGDLVEIRTRAWNSPTFAIDLDEAWLKSDSWSLPYYEVDHIERGTTTVQISKLRSAIDDDDERDLLETLGRTYANFLGSQCKITVNRKNVRPQKFQKWAYPPSYLPRSASLKVDIRDGEEPLDVKITVGLIIDRDAEAENYGAYFYCNNRLVIGEVRTRETGYYVTSEAGVPHPDASLCRAVIQINGPAEQMPWNSSKSDLNYDHAAYRAIRPKLIELISFFSSLSRRLKYSWDTDVFRYDAGSVVELSQEEITGVSRLHLPSLPRVRKLPYLDRLKKANKAVISSSPWTLGLVEAYGFQEVIGKQKFITKNRVSLILLDSNIEIALKEFIVNNPTKFPRRRYDDVFLLNLFKNRADVITHVQPHVSLAPADWQKIQHYYLLRNKLIHERATVGITDYEVRDYRAIAAKLLSEMFGLKFPAM